jgi:hypothetical protein
LLLSVAMLATGVPVATVTARATASAAAPLCTGNPVFVTASCDDPVLDQPYIDQDQPGTTTDPTTGITVSYRYIHGGFTGTAARFAFYFPAPGQYQGRFFESTYPTNSNENAIQDCSHLVATTVCQIAFALSNGAYVVSTNNAGGVPAGGALAAYRANAAAAKYSRVVAEQMIYHTSARPHGYLYGASGGAYQTVGAMENTDGVWDGAVPMVLGADNAIPAFMSVGALASQVLGDKQAQIADAVAPGGSGDPLAGLSPQERSVLAEVSRMAIPLRSWWAFDSSGNYLGLATIAAVTVRLIDPTYVTDFWTQPGYEGFSDPSVQAARIQYSTTVDRGSGSTITLASVPAGNLVGADLDVASGPSSGQSAIIAGVAGNTVFLTNALSITAGTTVEIDNSWLIALEYYQRHDLPTPDEYAWNQYRGADGQPLEPQRGGTCTTPKGSEACLPLGEFLTAATAGSVLDGDFHGKMIMLGSVIDGTSWSADWYRSQAEAAVSDLNDSYRLWYVDNADHEPSGPGTFPASTKPFDHIVQYTGVWEQALLDLDGWVSQGFQPPATTNYSIDSLDQVQLPTNPAQRLGVQPVGHLTVSANHPNGHAGQKVDVSAGQPVTFTLDATVPPGAGKIVRVEWDYQGSDSFAVSTPLAPGRPHVELHTSYAFNQLGTYFPVARVTSEQNGDTNNPYDQIQNLAGVRVVVHP